MGWLLEGLSELGDSPNEIAEGLIDSGYTGLAKRSLGNKLRDLDRGDPKARMWLFGAKGKSLLPVLRRELGLSDTEIDARLEGDGRRTASVPVTILGDVRAFDGSVDELPPGLPTELRRSGWHRHWWTAGSESEIAWFLSWARWNLPVSIVESHSWPSELPSGVQILHLSGPPPPKLLDDAIPPQVSVLVVSCHRPPDEGQGGVTLRRGRGKTPVLWTRLSSPAPGGWMDPLVAWFAGRVRPGGAFSVEAARQVAGVLDRADQLTTPADLVEALGWLDQTGEVPEVEELAADFVRRALVALRIRTQDRASFFVHFVANGLRKGLFDNAHGEIADTLLEAVLHGLVDEPSIESIEEAMSTGSTAEEKLEAVKRRLRPSPKVLRVQLLESGLLQRRSPEHLVLRPSWVGDSALGVAIDELLQGEVAAWGEACLFPHQLAAMVEEVAHRMESDDAEALLVSVFGAAEKASPPPAVLAALHACFRAAALVLLRGGSVAEPLLRQLWDLQMGNVVPLRSGTRPLVDVPSFGMRRLVNSDAFWELACLVISERLNDPVAPDVRLAPWSRGLTWNDLHLVASQWATACDRDASPDALAGALGVIARLARQVDEPPAVSRMVQMAGLVAQYQAQPERVPSKVGQIMRREFDAAMEHLGADGHAFARWLWTAWAASSVPHHLEGDPRVWAAAPEDLFQREGWNKAHSRSDRWRAFGDSGPWRSWIALYGGVNFDDAAVRAAWQAAPLVLVLEAARSGLLSKSRPAWEALWRRAPADVVAIWRDVGVEDAIVQGAWGTPPSVTAGGLDDLLEEWAMTASGESRERLLKLCHDHARSTGGWGRAAELRALFLQATAQGRNAT